MDTMHNKIEINMCIHTRNSLPVHPHNIHPTLSKYYAFDVKGKNLFKTDRCMQ